GYAKSRGRNLDALFDDNANPELLLPRPKKRCHGCLQMRVIELSQIALLYHSVHVVAVRTIVGREVLADAHQRAGLHTIHYTPAGHASRGVAGIHAYCPRTVTNVTLQRIGGWAR